MVEPDNLVLEYLRTMRSDIARLADEMHTMRVEMTSMRHQMIAISTLVDHDHSEIAVIKTRLDRIEQRLDLVE